MSQWVNGSVDGSMGRMCPGSMGQWVMGLGYDGSWVTNGDPWSTLIQTLDTNRTPAQIKTFIVTWPWYFSKARLIELLLSDLEIIEIIRFRIY